MDEWIFVYVIVKLVIHFRNLNIVWVSWNPKVLNVWKDDIYEKSPEWYDLFKNHNFGRTPRNNSSPKRDPSRKWIAKITFSTPKNQNLIKSAWCFKIKICSITIGLGVPMYQFWPIYHDLEADSTSLTLWNRATKLLIFALFTHVWNLGWVVARSYSKIAIFEKFIPFWRFFIFITFSYLL